MSERQVQNKVIKTLKDKGAYVIKTHPGLGTPTGAPDIFFFKGSIYGVIECKAEESSSYRPLQVETLRKFSRWGVYSKAVYKENVGAVCAELEVML